MKEMLLSGEDAWLDRVVFNPADNTCRLNYADWLSRKDDRRSQFLRRFVEASNGMNPLEFPQVPSGVSEEWVELIGYRLLERAAVSGFPELRTPLTLLARPALRMVVNDMVDSEIPIGASKIGGLPDLPSNYNWPIGKQCRAIYTLDTKDVEEPAGFVAQINLEETAGTRAGQELPSEGLLSIFCYVFADDPDLIGVMATLFPSCSDLLRTPFPPNATDGNNEMNSQRLSFEETLDVPGSGGPWEEDLTPDTSKSDDYWNGFYSTLRDLNQYTFMGYGKSFQERDPTPTKDSRHLMMVQNANGEMLHIQIPAHELVARSFSAITLEWVDFDV